MLEVVAVLTLGSLLLGAIVYLLVCVDPHQAGCLAQLQYQVLTVLPSFLGKSVRWVLGERMSGWLSSGGDYLCNTNHPLVQWFYLVLMWLDWYFLMFYGVFVYVPQNGMSVAHSFGINLLFGVCLLLYYMACRTSPGQVTKYNQAHYVQQYSYDQVVYFKDNTCKTCHVIKPAKSKHCSICKMCVAKFDHHCIWVRQCVGLHNYKYFLGFISSHAVVCLYAAWLGWHIFQGIIREQHLWEQVFILRSTGTPVAATTMIVYKYLFNTHLQLAFASILTFVMGVALTGFVCYHVYLLHLGFSTAEKIKRSDLQAYTDKAIELLTNYLNDKIDRKGEKLTEKQLKNYAKELEQFQREKEVLDSHRAVGVMASLREVLSQ